MTIKNIYTLSFIFAITIAIALVIIAALISKIKEYRNIILDMIDYMDDTQTIDEIYQEFQIQDKYLNEQIYYLKQKDGK